jgi:hypothetical protein
MMKLRISHRVMIISFFLLLLAGCREEEIVFSYSNSIVVVLMFTDKAYNRSILEGDYPIEYISGLAPSSHPGSGLSVSYDAMFSRVPYAGEAEVYDEVLITVLASIWA